MFSTGASFSCLVNYVALRIWPVFQTCQLLVPLGIDSLVQVPLSKYNETFKRQRRYIQHTLGPRVVPSYYPLIQSETASLLRALVTSPSEYLGHVRKYAGGLTLSVVYGYKPASNDDKFLAMAEECLIILANEIAAKGGIWAVDVFPFLKYFPSWLPGFSFKKKAAVWKPKMIEFIEAPFAHAKFSTEDGTILTSFCSKLLSSGDLDSRMEDEIKFSANSMFAASADTTVTTTSQFILAMLMYPEVLKKAQDEIDRVVGNYRLPDFNDRKSLPYVEAVLSEVWRWGTPVPLNLPHCLTKDDVYRGMFIPKDTLVIVNIWLVVSAAILHDESVYPDASTFNPDRFAPELSPEIKAERDPRNSIFGFGRRRCPGADLVESSVWLLLVSMLATLDIQKSVDTDGNVIEPEVKYSNSTFRVFSSGGNSNWFLLPSNYDNPDTSRWERTGTQNIVFRNDEDSTEVRFTKDFDSAPDTYVTFNSFTNVQFSTDDPEL
ncbi:hypothetical protein D9758_017177 [Tetrapyrgos nigripes]|uniref:Cytochrome P450 n=1 Tax=Tetrapyrgos nigripes TaxID=182062 RepID=A0A8H5FEF5_9AGAR|nr:hypothetical protein D9758_017177 [Tetrapyrgos nigripes]